MEEHHAHKLQSRTAQHSQTMSSGAPSQDMMSYWGSVYAMPRMTTLTVGRYKFETLSVLATPWHAASRDEIENREDAIVDNHAQYCSVVKTGIGKSRLILGGEVDARML